MALFSVSQVFLFCCINYLCGGISVTAQSTELDNNIEVGTTPNPTNEYLNKQNYTLNCLGNDKRNKPKPCTNENGKLIPRGPPKLKKGEQRRRSVAHLGHEHILSCPHSACPSATTTWFKDGKEVKPRHYSKENYQSKIEIDEGILKLSFNRDPDDGDYTCVVSNACGAVNHTIEVKSEIIQRNDAPTPKEELKNQTVLVGSNVTLNCETKVVDPGNPVDIYWYRIEKVNGSYRNENGTSKSRKLDTTFSTKLELTNLQVSDSTWYMCKLNNFFGTGKSSAFINVVESLPTSNTSLVFGILAGFFCIIIFGCCILMFLCYKKSRKSERDKQLAIENAKKVACWTKKVLVNRERSNDEQLHPRITIQKIRTEVRTQNGDAPNPLSEYEFPEDKQWEFSRSYLNITKILGEGAFGRVKLATAKALLKNGLLVPEPNIQKENEMKVAVKMLKEGHTDSDVTDLYSELEIMKRIGSHPNIINLLGECSQPAGSPLLVIVEYALFGNLRQFLKDRKPGTKDHLMDPKFNQVEHEEMIKNDCLQLQNSGSTITADSVDQLFPVSLKMMLSFALQVSRGMEFLSSRRCVHRDLAARNVLVSDGLVLKIADFGMARDLQENDYYRKVSDGRLPIKWMAPESLLSRLSTTMSDVWSFGILFWEIVTFGDTPYKNELSPKVFMELIKSGYKMKQPQGCPDSVYMIMKKCWEFMPENRPGWSELVTSLYDLHTTTDPDKYLDLSLPGVETPPETPETSKEGTVTYSGQKYYKQESDATMSTGFASNGTYDQHTGPYDQHNGTYDQQSGTYDQQSGTYDQHTGPLEYLRPLLPDIQNEMIQMQKMRLKKPNYIQVCSNESDEEDSAIEGSCQRNYAPDFPYQPGYTESSTITNTPISLSQSTLTQQDTDYPDLFQRSPYNEDLYLPPISPKSGDPSMSPRVQSLSPDTTREHELMLWHQNNPGLPLAATLNNKEVTNQLPIIQDHEQWTELRSLNTNRPAPLFLQQNSARQIQLRKSMSSTIPDPRNHQQLVIQSDLESPGVQQNINHTMSPVRYQLPQLPPQSNVRIHNGIMYAKSPGCKCDCEGFAWPLSVNGIDPSQHDENNFTNNNVINTISQPTSPLRLPVKRLSSKEVGNPIKSIYPQHDLKDAKSFEYDTTFTRIKEHPGHNPRTNEFNASYLPADSFITNKDVGENKEDEVRFNQQQEFKYERISSLNQTLAYQHLQHKYLLKQDDPQNKYHQQDDFKNQQQDKDRYQLPPKQFDIRCQEDFVRNQQKHMPPVFHESIAYNLYNKEGYRNDDMYTSSIRPIMDVIKHEEVTSPVKNQLTVSEEYEQYTSSLLEKRDSTESGYQTKRSSSECDSNNS